MGALVQRNAIAVLSIVLNAQSRVHPILFSTLCQNALTRYNNQGLTTKSKCCIMFVVDFPPSLSPEDEAQQLLGWQVDVGGVATRRIQRHFAFILAEGASH